MTEITVDVGHKNYPVIISGGSLKDCGLSIKAMFDSSRAVIITDTNVDRLYADVVQKSLEKAGIEYNKIVIAAGEVSKSNNTLLNIYDKLIELNTQKTDVIIALGGGVVGDIAGFAASGFLRGIDYVQIPTTLTSQVDSSVGGKVAINHNGIKNIVGAFYHPSMVLIDPDVLKTLSDCEFANGMAEVIKTAAILDGEMFFDIASLSGRKEIMAEIEGIIKRCVDLKAEVVRHDERDNGYRIILNFGHTLGHAIEKVSDNKIPHGQAVAMGMVAMSELGERLDITQKDVAKILEDVLCAFGLDTHIPYKKEELIDAIYHDKKIRNDKINVVFLKDIGDVLVKEFALKELGELL